MKQAREARLYAKTLFDVAQRRRLVDRIREEVAYLGALSAECVEWRQFAAQHALEEAKRRAVLQDLFASRLHALTYKFVRIMDERHDLGLLPDVAGRFEIYYRKAKGIVRVHVTSTRPLEESNLARIRQKLATRFGGDVETSAALDPELLGGFTLRVEDTVYDFSLAGQLDALQRQMAAN